MNPLHWPERLLQTPGPLAAKACLNGTSGRTDGRPARALVEPLRRVRGNTWLWWTAKGVQLLATGRGKAVRTAAVPARAVIGGTGCIAPQPAGAPGPPERTHASGGLGVSRDRRARREHSCASRPEGTSALEKTSADGGGSHRRSRAREQWLWKDVATKTRLTRARSVRDLQRGKDICPMPVGGRAVGHRCHQALAGLARCAGWCERAARQRCVRYTREPPARGPTAPHGCSGGRWSQPPEP